MTTNPYDSLLTTVATIALEVTLARKVPFTDLLAHGAPNWLFTSGRANRFNPAGVNCLYMAGDQHVAGQESASGLPGKTSAYAPEVTYWAEVRLGWVLDLTDAAVVRELSFKDTDLFGAWPRKGRASKTQLLGESVARSSNIVAIRYTSCAAQALGHNGLNVVIYRDRVHAPDTVRILGPDKKPLQSWP